MKAALKPLCAGLGALLLGTTAFAAVPETPAVIPLPQRWAWREGTFRLVPDTRIFADAGSLQTADQLASLLRQSTGYALRVQSEPPSGVPPQNGILLTTQLADASLGPEGYELSVAAGSVVIRAPAQAGLFYGVQTLRLLLPPEILSTHVVAGADWRAPCVQIEDWPQFRWRGLLLDVSRHFYAKAEVERVLSLMALHKLNTFHWHLTDDQVWRIEIEKYPKLTRVGAWRRQVDFDPPPGNRAGDNAHPAWAEPTPDKFGPDGRYGGFYTQDDIREVVTFAAALHITIVPEIEMPGHSIAAMAAYPQFGCSAGPFSTDLAMGIHGIDDPANCGVYNPANPGTFLFLDEVLAEVSALFPGRYIHIGGDEVPTGIWAKVPACRVLMQKEGLKNEAELQGWFTRRMEKVVSAHGKVLIGWSEITKGGLPAGAAVMDWIGGSAEAASQGHDVVMTPTGCCYFDLYQLANHQAQPRAWGGYIPLGKVYSCAPVPASLPPPLRPHILGAQGNLWTESVDSLPHAEYMLFPRACALAEVDWSPEASRHWGDFLRRLRADERRLDELGVNYCRATPEAGSPRQ